MKRNENECSDQSH